MIQLEQQRQLALASPKLEASQLQQAVQQQQLWLPGLAGQKQRGGQQAQHDVQDAVSA
jgi:hypothetical protein